MSSISAENAFIFRITHIDNIPWILRNGIHCRNSQNCDPNFRTIGDPELIGKRATRLVPVGPLGTLSDYVPFHFTSFSPMLYKIKTGHGVPSIPISEIVVLVSNLPRLVEIGTPFVYTDRHAYLQAAQFFVNLADLHHIDWKLIAPRNFKRDANDPEKVERYQAETLVYRHVPVAALIGMACADPETEARLVGMQSEAGVSLKAVVKRNWFFE